MPPTRPFHLPIPTLTRSRTPNPILALPPRFFRCLHTPTPTPPHRPLRPFTPFTPPHRHNSHHHHHQHQYSTTPPAAPKPYTFEEIHSLTTTTTTTTTTNPPPSSRRTIIIDVREPSELQQSGRIPGAYSMPVTSNPDAFSLSEGDFRERFGFEKPKKRRGRKGGRGEEEEEGAGLESGAKEREAGDGGVGSEGGDGEGEGVEEVIFYCKAGVRSRAAARMAREWEGVKVGDMTGGWMEWEERGGQVER